MKYRAILQILFLITATILAVTTHAEEPLKVGWIGPLTGNAAVLGVDSAPAVKLVIDKINAGGGINGRQVKLYLEDDQYVTAKTVRAYNKLVHKNKVKVIITLTYGGLFALAERAERDGVLLIDPLDCDERIAALPSNTICIAKTSEDLGYSIAEHASKSNRTPIGIIYFDGDPFMGIVADASVKRLKKLGTPVVFSQSYNNETTDFRTILTRAKKKKVKSLFFFGYDQVAIAMKQARQLGLDAQFYGLATLSSKAGQEIGGEALNGSIAPIWFAPGGKRYDRFIADFHAVTGRKPNMDLCTVPSYDVATLIVEGFKQNGEDLEALRSFFYGLKDYTGLSGTFTLDPDGITRSFELTMNEYRDGAFTKIRSK